MNCRYCALKIELSDLHSCNEEPRSIGYCAECDNHKAYINVHGRCSVCNSESVVVDKAIWISDEKLNTLLELLGGGMNQLEIALLELVHRRRAESFGGFDK